MMWWADWNQKRLPKPTLLPRGAYGKALAPAGPGLFKFKTLIPEIGTGFSEGVRDPILGMRVRKTGDGTSV